MPIAISPLVSVPQFANTGIHHIISIGDADQPRPDISAYAGDFTLHRFVFNDISSPHDLGPKEIHIARLLKVFEIIAPESNVLFHCMAGVSRSTASAFIYLVYRKVPYDIAYQTCIQARGPFIQPNLYMIKLADRLMGHEGVMLAYVARASGHEDWLVSASNV